MKIPDSLIFDMDGTLWDAVDTYVMSWNAGFEKAGLNRRVTRSDLDYMMGWEKRKALDHMLPEHDIIAQERIFRDINDFRAKLIPKKGGILYPGVKDGLRRLSQNYRLFIVSNCPENLISQFIEFAGIGKYITDEIAHGVNNKPKHHNIQLLIDKHNLQNPMYVGDTETDSSESEKAGIPFVFVDYGFGETERFDLKFHDFHSLADYFMNLK